MKKLAKSTEGSAERQAPAAEEVWDLRLYVAGQAPKSLAAFANLKKLCEEHLAGRYRIEVVDLLENPQLAAGDQIVALPTFVRKLPEPLRKIVGDLSNTERAWWGCSYDPPNARNKRGDWPMVKKKPDATEAFERSLAEASGEPTYVLRLYVTGMTPRSTEAFAAIKSLCEEHLAGRYQLEVIDIYQHPQLAKDEQIIAAPTLVKKLPLPLRRLIGNLSDTERVLLGLDLRRKN